MKAGVRDDCHPHLGDGKCVLEPLGAVRDGAPPTRGKAAPGAVQGPARFSAPRLRQQLFPTRDFPSWRLKLEAAWTPLWVSSVQTLVSNRVIISENTDL